MKSLLLILAFSLMLIPVQVKSSAQSDESFVDKINKAVPGKGVVAVIQDEKITERLLKSEKNTQAMSDDDYVEVNGYRIQVFVGNNQRIAKNEAYSKETDIKSVFSGLSTYVEFTAPFWRLKAGDFQSYQDAQKILSEMRSKFPEYGREMSIVKDKVRIKVQ